MSSSFGSYSTNYTKVGNILIQYGAPVSIGRDEKQISLPTSYGNTNYVVCANHNWRNQQSDGSGEYRIISKTTSKFTIRICTTYTDVSAENDSYVYWITIGK